MVQIDKDYHNTLFILSVDTEEEWHWDEPFPEQNCQVKNVQQIPALQICCESIGVRPTYFVDYAVADNSQAVEAINSARQRNQCEIGAHLHPWCNPPLYGKTGEAESHVVNLPIEHTAAKLDKLITTLNDKFSINPTSFRTGRWGINNAVLDLLANRGFTVDSSIYPFYKNEYFSCEGSVLTPYWPDPTNPLNPGSQRQIMEIPVTAGFNRTHYNVANCIHQLGESAPLKYLHTVGLLWHSRLLRKLYLSPELTDEHNLCRLIDTSLNRGHKVIHMYLHSSSLIDGVTGLFDKQNSLDIICDRIKQSVEHLQSKGPVQFCTISEAAAILAARNNEEEVLA